MKSRFINNNKSTSTSIFIITVGSKQLIFIYVNIVIIAKNISFSNNIINAIDSILNIKTINKPKKIKEYTKMIKEENHRMLKQVEDVLRISQLERRTLQIEKKSIKIHDVISLAINHVSLIVKSKKGKIEINLNAFSDTILGNTNHLTNVFVNILDNAIKYSKNPPLIIVKTIIKLNKIHITFEDKGIGIDSNSQKLVFQKFYRVQTGNIHNIKGHGLGLTYVKKIIQIHGGQINLKSKKGVGTTFQIFIPLIVKNK